MTLLLDMYAIAVTVIVPPVGGRSIAISVSISVCLFGRISQKPHVQISTNFLNMLPVAVAQSFPGGNAIRYVLPVLWMTSCFRTMEQMGQNKRRRVRFVHFARWRHHSDVRQCCLVKFARRQHRRRGLLSPTAFRSCCCYCCYFAPSKWTRYYDHRVCLLRSLRTVSS